MKILRPLRWSHLLTGVFNQETVLVGRGILHDCEIFENLCLKLFALPWRGLGQSVLLAVLLPRVLGVSLQLVVLLCPLLLDPLGLGRLQPLLEQ